jgi:serpin B
MVEMLHLLGHKNKIDLNKVNTTLSSIISSFKTVKMANAIFTKFKPEQVFLSLTEKYNSTVDNLISAEQVNSWCSKATNNTITKIIDDINNALMILINAIYFKGNWEKKFDEKLTNKLVFYNFNKEEKITDFMNITNNFDYFENQNIQAIQIKYNKDNLKAFIILPKTEKDINNYIKNLTKEKYNKIIKGLKNQKVILSLPKFEMNYQEELKDILISMGMKDAFGPADSRL